MNPAGAIPDVQLSFSSPEMSSEILVSPFDRTLDFTSGFCFSGLVHLAASPVEAFSNIGTVVLSATVR